MSSQVGVPRATYTHKVHMARCVESWCRHEVVLSQQWVQVKVAKETLCGLLVDAWTHPDGAEMWVVEISGFGRRYVRTANTYQCSGLDGFCACAEEAQGRGPACGETRSAAGAERLTC